MMRQERNVVDLLKDSGRGQQSELRFAGSVLHQAS